MLELIKVEHSDQQRREPLDLNPMKRTALDAVFNSKIPMAKGVVSPVKLSHALDAMLPPNAIVTAEPGVSAIYPSAFVIGP